MKLLVILCALSVVLICGLISAGCGDANEQIELQVMPWKVGQYVVYQILSTEGVDTGNRYKISLVAKERIGEEDYFWVEIDIWEHTTYYQDNLLINKLKKNISFKALIPPKNSSDLLSDPANFISNGIFPQKALKLMVQIAQGPWISVNPEEFFSHQNIIEDTPYVDTPHAQGKIDFNRINISKETEDIVFPSEVLACYHLWVATTPEREYSDEGIDLWYSPEIPVLGIARLEFSKTLYWQKWVYQCSKAGEKRLFGWWRSLYEKRVSGRRRPDSCVMVLLNYGR